MKFLQVVYIIILLCAAYKGLWGVVILTVIMLAALRWAYKRLDKAELTPFNATDD